MVVRLLAARNIFPSEGIKSVVQVYLFWLFGLTLYRTEEYVDGAEAVRLDGQGD